MKSQKVEQFLTERGYKFYPPANGDADYVVAKYYRIDYGSKVPDCLTNDKPPQFAIVENFLAFQTDNFHSFSVGITNEAPQGWADFKFYSLKEDDILERIDKFESALLRAWTALFEVK